MSRERARPALRPDPPSLPSQVENQAHDQGNFAVWEKEGQDQLQKDMKDRMQGFEGDTRKI